MALRYRLYFEDAPELGLVDPAVYGISLGPISLRNQETDYMTLTVLPRCTLTAAGQPLAEGKWLSLWSVDVAEVKTRLFRGFAGPLRSLADSDSDSLQITVNGAMAYLYTCAYHHETSFNAPPGKTQLDPDLFSDLSLYNIGSQQDWRMVSLWISYFAPDVVTMQPYDELPAIYALYTSIARAMTVGDCISAIAGGFIDGAMQWNYSADYNTTPEAPAVLSIVLMTATGAPSYSARAWPVIRSGLTLRTDLVAETLTMRFTDDSANDARPTASRIFRASPAITLPATETYAGRKDVVLVFGDEAQMVGIFGPLSGFQAILDWVMTKLSAPILQGSITITGLPNIKPGTSLLIDSQLALVQAVDIDYTGRKVVCTVGFTGGNEILDLVQLRTAWLRGKNSHLPHYRPTPLEE